MENVLLFVKNKEEESNWYEEKRDKRKVRSVSLKFEVMGRFGVKDRNLEGKAVVDLAKRMEMAVVNTFF